MLPDSIMLSADKIVLYDDMLSDINLLSDNISYLFVENLTHSEFFAIKDFNINQCLCLISDSETYQMTKYRCRSETNSAINITVESRFSC
jgi:hypothetical protein